MYFFWIIVGVPPMSVSFLRANKLIDTELIEVFAFAKIERPSRSAFIKTSGLNKSHVIPGVNLKLFKIKEKLFDIIHFVMFEQNMDDNINSETEIIYKNIYKTISLCISNILIDEQNIAYNKSQPPSPTLSSYNNSRGILRRRGSWSSR